MNRLIAFLMTVVMVFGIGCSCNENRVYEIPPTDTTIQISADEFDGALLGRLFEQGKIIGGLPGLETFVNSPDNPINFLDLNKNEKIDYVEIVESREESVTILEFVVTQKSNPGLPIEQISVYTIRVNNSPNGYVINGGHPSYVSGGNYFSHTVPHSHGLSFGEAYLLTHLFMPRPMFISPGMGMGWTSRSYMTPSARIGFQNSYRNTTRTTSVPRSSVAPQGFSAGPRAAKVGSSFSSRPGGGLSLGSGSGMKSFRTQQSSGSLNTSGFRPNSTSTRSTTSTSSRASSTPRSSFGSSRSSSGGSSRSSRGGRR